MLTTAVAYCRWLGASIGAVANNYATLAVSSIVVCNCCSSSNTRFRRVVEEQHVVAIYTLSGLSLPLASYLPHTATDRTPSLLSSSVSSSFSHRFLFSSFHSFPSPLIICFLLLSSPFTSPLSRWTRRERTLRCWHTTKPGPSPTFSAQAGTCFAAESVLADTWLLI